MDGEDRIVILRVNTIGLKSITGCRTLVCPTLSKLLMMMRTITDKNKHGEDIFLYTDYGTCRLIISPKCPKVLFLSTLVVDEEHRRQGVANSLLAEAEKIAVQRGCQVVTLYAELGWRVEWYERHGFVPVGDCEEDNLIIMSKFLSNVQKTSKN